MAKKNQLTVIKESNCLNCNFPFSGHEIFCPSCGQKNKGSKITFRSFVREVFAGFFSWDAKFWKTLRSLLFKPGKVPKEYIQGKRSKYSNPFRFYLTTSILFFLLVGLNNTIKEYRSLSSTEQENNDEKVLLQQASDSINKELSQKEKEQIIETGIGQFTLGFQKGMKKGTKNKFNKDTIKNPGNFDNLVRFNTENPTLTTDEALDSLGITKNFNNRLKYSKAKTFTSIINGNGVKSFVNDLISRISIALFILLPIFALFFKLIYIRKKYTYVEHLIFIFHIQTVFFIIFTLYVLFDIGLYKQMEKADSTVMLILILVFMVYLFIAMKRFYNQGFFKTFIKYFLANLTFFLLASLGISVLTVITFMLN